MLQKYVWDVESLFFRTIDKEYSSFGISFSIAKNYFYCPLIFLKQDF